jgi:hypothetical protein
MSVLLVEKDEERECVCVWLRELASYLSPLFPVSGQLEISMTLYFMYPYFSLFMGPF